MKASLFFILFVSGIHLNGSPFDTAPPAWMTEQIDKDLAPYASGVPQELLDSTMDQAAADEGLARFSIKDGHVEYTIKGPTQEFIHRSEIIKYAIHEILKQTQLPQVDFIIALHDDGHNSNQAKAPIFSFAKNKHDKHILIPDFEALRGYQQQREAILAANEKYPWKDKIEKAFWRGACTGGFFTPEQWRSLARSQLVLLSIKFPDKIDAKFTILCQGAESNPEMLSTPQLMGPRVSPAESLEYKYLVDVDGNSCAFTRYYWALLSNSVVLKQSTDLIQWYYGAIKPYEHYIPVGGDFTDLMEKIEWAKSHDAESKRIAQNATTFAENNLTTKDIQMYLYLTLTKYAKLQKRGN